MMRKIILCLFVAWSSVGCASHRAAASEPAKIPVVLDTDIGDDIDDTYALVMLLKSPRFDVKLITTTEGKPEYRARLIAKILTIAGRTDIPIGLGAGNVKQDEHEAAWIADFPLASYRGHIEHDGVGAMIHAVQSSKEPITIIGIGPLQTIATAIERDPDMPRKANFVGMQGSVFKGYDGKATPDGEWNVVADVAAAKKVFAAQWRHAAITPLDTCGLPAVSLDKPRFHQLSQSDDPLARAIVESYAAWRKGGGGGHEDSSTTLFDTVAIYLADPENNALLNLEPLKLVVTDKGITAASPDGKPFDVATSWNDVEAYRNYLLHVLAK